MGRLDVKDALCPIGLIWMAFYMHKADGEKPLKKCWF